MVPTYVPMVRRRLHNVIILTLYLLYKYPSIDSYFLMSSPVPVLIIICAYFLMVAVGPRLMKNRAPFKLEKILLVYNALQILVSASLCYQIVSVGIFKDGFLHGGCHYPMDTKDPMLIFGTYIYFFTKITELLDTVFFVLRKKNNQITFLHVFHHASMVLYMWSYLKYAAGGDGAVLAFLNCIVHVTMYTYYLLAGLGPRFQKYLWWKKYVTELQLIQFLLMLFYNVWTFFSPRCRFSPVFTGIISFNVTVYLALFLNFYVSSYKKKNKTKEYPQIDAMFLMSNPIPLTLILSTYFLIVSIGPRIMKNRHPMKLDKILIVYNLFQIIMSGIIIHKIVRVVKIFQDGIIYAGCRYSVDTKDPELLYGTWLFFFTKVTELLDTVFFVLRKKNNQITFLHVYHHALMVVYMWSYLKYAAGGDGPVQALLNCTVHTVMYSYYLLAGLGPTFQKYLWWKKYVTKLQLIQFVIMLLYNGWTYYTPRCQFSGAFSGFLSANVTLFLILFTQFYFKNYKNKNKRI
ncbi:uncharacterized protein LOC126366929 [Pectinophora gossypiella]|uniref:uncharacterized protein LOC126366929 n=1 Tax=Pectinophora gossypiella TaxID=13191 RepID=UPI00214F4D32|nr:uncharacterized protein LOC126366929 [Pectinophora gossypiella]